TQLATRVQPALDTPSGPEGGLAGALVPLVSRLASLFAIRFAKKQAHRSVDIVMSDLATLRIESGTAPDIEAILARRDALGLGSSNGDINSPSEGIDLRKGSSRD